MFEEQVVMMSERGSVGTVVEREVRMNAMPATVFRYLTDAEMIVTWMGRKATLDVRPGGLFRVSYNDEDVARGEFVDIVPDRCVVVTWGWEAAGAATPPGASTVEITLTPDGDGTLLRLVHQGLSEDEARSHSEGWDFFLPRLVQALN